MKICKTEEEFIEYVAPIAQRVCKRYGFKPSILVAQTFHENGAAVPSNFDNSGIYDLMKYNNMVGQKSSLLNDTWSEYSVWPGMQPGKYDEYSFEKITPEEYSGKMKNIPDRFRKFDSVEQSLADYVLFLLYAKDSVSAKSYRYGLDVVNIQDPYQLIKAVGKKYATGSSYAENVYNIVKRYNLTKYDDLTNVKPTDIVPDILKKSTSKTSATKTKKTVSNTDTIKIIDLTAQNTPVRWDNTREALVFHFLGVAGADNPYLYGGGYGGQWYISRKGEIYHAVKPGGTVYAVGSGGWGLKTTKWNNSNTENVEMGCECDGNKNDIFDKKWWFHMATQEAAVKFARYWLEMRGYGVSEKTVNERILVHNTITNKPCPAPWLHGAGYSSPREKGQRNWSFEEFKKKIWQGYNGKTVSASSSVSSTSTSTKSYLSKGDSGDEVKKLQTMLNACGYNCGTVDGDFGSKTDAAVRALQSDTELSVDGMYGVKTKAVLEEMYKNVNAQKTDSTSKGAKVFLAAVKAVADYARTNGWTYGNSTTTPPCADKKISCDRLIARAMYDLGYTDQPKGGFVCGNVINEHLLKWGFTKVTDKSKIKPGAVVAVKKKTQNYMNHVFVVKSYDPKTDRCDKFDMGSNTRIKTAQPFRNVKLVEWSDREFVCAWNVPENLKAKTTPKKDTSGTVYNGVDYSPVYNYSYYRKKYSDLQKAFGTDKEAYFKHFCQYGMNEGRKASSAFDVLKYKARYEDLRKAFGDNLPEYYKHYVIFGKKEGRKAL